jgi:hypothetical protein
MLPDQLAALDNWIAQQPDPKPTRPEAVRQIIRIVARSATSTIVQQN